MKKIIPMLLPLLFLGMRLPMRDIAGKNFLIAGQNSIHKVYYAASSVYAKSYKGVRALDSDRSTAWISKKGKGPHWFEIDFRVKRIMSKIVVYPGRKDRYHTIKKIKLQFMYNNTWFDFTEKMTIKKRFLGYKHLDRVVFNLGGIDASTFRILIPEGATYQGYAAIAEIETYIGTSKLQYFDERLKGMFYPIKNGYLPENDYSYPNAPRNYRGGRHAGLDIFYYHTDDSYTPLRVTKKTPIYAAAGGIILRADWHYKPMKVREWKGVSRYFRRHPRTFVRRSFGGIQVWIDHQNGVVTAYNHLSKIDKSIHVGDRVKKGERIGWVGNSGLLGEAEKKNYGIHLHFEIWVDGNYLGYGMKMADIKKYIKWIFFPLQ